MRRTFLFGTVLAAAMAVGVGAQGASSTQDRSSDQRGKGEQNVTVTGCLQSADTWSGGTSGSMTGSTAGSTAGTASSSTGALMTGTTSPSGSYGKAATAAGARFVLTNVSMNGKTDDTTSGMTSGQPGATGTTGSFDGVSSALWLMAAGSTDNWSKYLNHRVEVKGTLNNSPSPAPYESAGSATATASGSTTASGSPTGSESGTSSSMYGSKNRASMGTLHVASIKDVSGTCSSR